MGSWGRSSFPPGGNRAHRERALDVTHESHVTYEHTMRKPIIRTVLLALLSVRHQAGRLGQWLARVAWRTPSGTWQTFPVALAMGQIPEDKAVTFYTNFLISVLRGPC